MEPVGLVAGSGRFPVLFAQAAARSGRQVVAAAHEGETDPELERHVARLSWVKLGQLGHIAEVLRGGGCAQAVFCGGLRKVRLLNLRPDWLGVKVLAGLRSFGDDAALRAIAEALEREGVRVVSPLPFVPDLLATKGPLGRRHFTEEQRTEALNQESYHFLQFRLIFHPHSAEPDEGGDKQRQPLWILRLGNCK